MKLEYERKQQRRPWQMSGLYWLMISAACAVAYIAGAIATGGRINGAGDVAFILIFGFVGLFSLAWGLISIRR
jgi:hypothetical protein